MWGFGVPKCHILEKLIELVKCQKFFLEKKP